MYGAVGCPMKMLRFEVKDTRKNHSCANERIFCAPKTVRKYKDRYDLDIKL